MTTLWRKLSWNYIHNNQQSVTFTLLYFALICVLYTSRYHAYSIVNSYLATARACGLMLNVLCAFVLVLICRKSINFCRSIGLARYLPLDHYVYFHKMTGWAIAFFSVGHTLAHLINFWHISKVTTIPYSSLLFSTNLRIGWIGGMACLSGWLLWVVLAIMLIFSMNFIRRSGKFEWFYFSHKLTYVFLLLLFIHGPVFWRYLVFPFTLHLLECLFRFINTKKDGHGLTYVIEGTLLPSRVVRLLIRKPIFFQFQPGDFVFVKAPWITQYEWHPITISSAPEDEYITLHIRAVGEWTNRIYNHFEQAETMTLKEALAAYRNHNQAIQQQRSSSDLFDPNTFKENLVAIRDAFTSLSKRTMILPIPNGCDNNGCMPYKKKSGDNDDQQDNDALSAESVGDNNENINNNNNSVSVNIEMTPLHTSHTVAPLETLEKEFAESLRAVAGDGAVFLNQPLKIHLDGPYGAPSSHIFHTEHAILVATGIGVTPFASILQSIIYRHTEKQRQCPQCNFAWTEKVPSQRVMSLRKVDFIWINRDNSSFEWFVEKLAHLKRQQLLSVAGALEGNVRESQFLDIHMYVTNHAATISTNYQNLQSQYNDVLRWNTGRPNFSKLFNEIRKSNPASGKVTVFYCGRPDLAPTLRTVCNQLRFSFKKEVF